MATLWDKYISPITGQTVTGYITIRAPRQRVMSADTLANVLGKVWLTAGAFEVEDLPEGPYVVTFHLSGQQGGKAQVSITVPAGVSRLADLVDAQTEWPAAVESAAVAARNEAIAAAAEAVAAAESIGSVSGGALGKTEAATTYVRSVNGVPVDPVTGNVEIEAGGSGPNLIKDSGTGMYVIGSGSTLIKDAGTGMYPIGA